MGLSGFREEGRYRQLPFSGLYRAEALALAGAAYGVARREHSQEDRFVYN